MTLNQKNFLSQKQRNKWENTEQTLVISKLVSTQCTHKLNQLLLCKHHLPVIFSHTLCRDIYMHVDGNDICIYQKGRWTQIIHRKETEMDREIN